ncbi:WSC domain-containing protein [Lophium mytilinum]|uniref:WSC domain-containing protein n=1 Tax=Lophium mytilinum TaxID=390894 RepID=A0A6A6QSJ9_9PEZI|nr:WSC domain-containing protein [Lophium mytilinum]
MLLKSHILLPLISTLLTPASSTFVVQCFSRLFDERADPIVNPGAPAGHVHAIVGGNGFNFSMDYDKARASTCSTCYIKEDLSNYWTPKMYYHAKNGSFIPVPINGDNQYGDMGGMAIYYLNRKGPDNDKLHPFPKGFRMLAGDPLRRASSTDYAGMAVQHQCNVAGGPFINQALPTRKCDSIRTQIVMPSCWDGKNLDSADHKSHMSYPTKSPNSNYDGGRCPSTHPVHMMTLFYEVTYNTNHFANDWYSDKQPFVFSNGDETGYGFHGDFVNGWDIPTLQKGIDTCVDGVTDCEDKVFTKRTQAETQSCKLPNMIAEPVSGILEKLPGCNPLTAGPAYATKVENCPAAKIAGVTTASLGVPDLTKSKGWKYIGCGTDDAGSRTLNGPQTSGPKMTVETCVDFCKGKGSKYAGVEYSGECYCGNSIAADRAPVKGVAGNCLMKCNGNTNEICGGAAAISLYQTCAGGACSNAVKKRSQRLAAGHAHHARSLVGKLIEAAS